MSEDLIKKPCTQCGGSGEVFNDVFFRNTPCDHCSATGLEHPRMTEETLKGIETLECEYEYHCYCDDLNEATREIRRLRYLLATIRIQSYE